MNLRRFLLIFGVIIIGLVGCTKETPITEQMYEHLEESVNLESDYATYQQEIYDLEKEEQDIYNRITELSSDDLDEIKTLAREAIEIIDERKDLMKLERESINASKEEFLKVESLINEVEEEDIKSNADKMFDKMVERYTSYEELAEAYQESLNLEKEFYEMYQDEDTNREDTSAHIDKLNDSYGHILEKNETFNELTREYNELKRTFYLSTDMEIVYE